MTNPYTAGGGGTHLEARVAASCLVAMLCEVPIRGLPGDFAMSVKSQRAAFDDPLDDLIVDGTGSDGRATQLHLQVTNKLSFTENDEKWVDILQRAWDTFSKPGFDPVFQRIGVGLGTYNAKADRHYQSVLNWAVHSTDANHFSERIAQGDYSHEDKRSFMDTVRTVLGTYAARTIADDELWRFLKAFVIVHYDFQSTASSRDEAGAIDRLRNLLSPDRRGQAKAIWDHLVAKAGEMIPAGGGATRATLVEALKRDRMDVGPAPSLWKDIQALRRESRRALDDIKSHMQGLKLHRASAYQQVREALNGGGRFVQIDGGPGTGKSVLLKEIAEEYEHFGPVFVLKDTRIHPKGWAAHAHILRVSDDVSALLREFACAGEPILFIDGIDKITDPAVQLTVNDVIKAIASEDALSAWRMLVTIREQNLRHLETWLDSDALKKLPLRTIEVKPLDEAELELVAGHFPRLSPLLTQSGGPDIILKRPFFLNALLALSANAGTAQLPATEVELLKLWWEMGGSDRKDFADAQHRRNLLVAMAEKIAHAPNAPIPIRDLSPEPLAELKDAGVLRDKELGHSVVFTHDIYEEWSLCELLVGQQANITEFLKQTGEPDALIRPVQLLGTYVLETDATSDSWKALLTNSSENTLRPVWQRTVLTSCLQSTRTTHLLGKLTEYLSENNSERLRKLLLAMTTIEVLPNPLFLNEQIIPDLTPEERAKYAHIDAVPKPLTWIRFLDWLMPQMTSASPSLIPDLLPVFQTWQGTYAGQKIRYCREIGGLSYAWLQEVEKSHHPRDFKDYRSPFGGALSGKKDVEKQLRALFLSSAGDVPKLVADYLRAHAASDDDVHVFREKILKNCAMLMRYLPGPLVDFILSAYLENPFKRHDDHPFGGLSDHDFDELGIAGYREFYPASPAQAPFLGLLRLHEEEGLRLIRGFCNHSIAIWRELQTRGRSWSAPMTPIPVTLTFPWGAQTFWGDGRAYLWFRGLWGNHAVESALMALEQWALEKLERGAPFDEVFRKVIEGQDSVAALGIGVSLCLAQPGASLPCAFPLVTSPYIWEWDIPRFVQESSRTNEMGNWVHDRDKLSAVRKLNQKPHRKQDIRSLVPYFVFSGDEALIEFFTSSVLAFPEHLPLSYEEEKESPEHIAALREKMRLFAEQADPQYFKAAPTADGNHIKIWSEPPSQQTEAFKEQQQQHVQLNAYMGVALWADKSIELDKIDEKFSLEDALAKAQEWDSPDLFDLDTDSLEHRHRTAAVAGTAAVAARHCSTEMWTEERAAWCLNVLERAGTAAGLMKELNVRSALLLMDPAVFAAHGYAALLARGQETDRCQQAILNLALDAVQGVQTAVFASAKYYADVRPDFYWVLLSLALKECVVRDGKIPDFHSVAWDEREAERKLALLEQAEADLAGDSVPAFPHIPMPWIKAEKSARKAWKDTKGYARNETVFLYHLADKLLPQLRLEPILSDSSRRSQFLSLVGELLEFTFQEIVPPFAKTKRDHGGSTAYEWVYAFSSWCGRLCAHLTRDEAKNLIISPVWSRDKDTALLILQSLMRSFMIHAFLGEKEIKDEQIAFWKELVDWMLQSPEWRHNGKGDHLDREFTACAFTTLFCAAPDFSPLICGVDPGWPHLSRFLTIIECSIREFGKNVTLYLAVITFLKRGGFDLMPEPALGWLQSVVVDRKADQKFWTMNGEDTVELLKRLIAEKEHALTADHRKAITLIADILVDNGVRGAGFLQQELLRAG
jgi:hypothetical protein